MLKEHEFIFCCARLKIESPQAQRTKELIKSPFDWENTIKICEKQQCLPFLYYNLGKLNLLNIIPQVVFSRLENCYYSNLAKNSLLEKEILLVIEAAEHKQIKIMPFRGFDFMHRLYGNLALRIMADVDILIKDTDLPQIKEIISLLGYKRSKHDLDKNERNGFDICFEKEISTNFMLYIEIHRLLAPARPHKLNLPLLWERENKLSVNGQTVYCLSAEDALLSIALHLKRHTRRLNLKFIIDSSELLNSAGNQLDWPYIKNSAKENSFRVSVYACLYLSKELLNAKIPEEAYAGISPSALKKYLLRMLINKNNFFNLTGTSGLLLRILLFDSPIDIFLYLFKVSFLERFIYKNKVDHKQQE